MQDADALPQGEEAVPEFYIDSYNLSLSPYTVVLDMGARQGPENTETLVRIRMSPAHAKVMSILFKRAMREYEDVMRMSVGVSPELLAEKHINLETDW